MVSQKPLPPAMKDLKDDEKTLEMFIAWPIEMRCQYIYGKTEHEGWPVERTCAMFKISSSWYRDRAMRFGDEWENEYQQIQEEGRKYREFHNRATKIMNIDFSSDANKNRLDTIIFSIQEYQLQAKEELFEYESIPDELLIEAGLIFESDIVPDEFICAAEGIMQNGFGTIQMPESHSITHDTHTLSTAPVS